MRQNFSDKTAKKVEKERKQKLSLGTVQISVTMIASRNVTRTKWANKGLECSAELWKVCKAEGKHIYSTMCETKTAFAEHTMRAMKNLLKVYMEDYGFQYLDKMAHCVKNLEETVR